ncbi:hypothetical protein F5Y08DRAFT_291947 [Xylaria arbuscula]|nr:hypothetical protein F5Y08DRAFT_291947 [Xylaria arbuscula]
MEDPVDKLINEFASLLDQPTILSIANDYDLTDTRKFAAARETLLSISEYAPAEEATGFNPSGSKGCDLPSSEATESDHKSNDGLATNTEASSSRSRSRSLSHNASSRPSSPTSESEAPSAIHVRTFDQLEPTEKLSQLAAIFVSLRRIDISMALRKAKGDADLAMDELLNLQHLEQTGDRPKGVDGFYKSDNDAPLSKKQGRKKKKKGSKAAASKRANTATPSEEPSHDDVDDADNIKFLSDSFTLPFDEAADVYQRNKCSLGAAIVATLESYIAINLPPFTYPSKQQMIEEQQKRIPWVPHDYFSPIFDITVSPQAAIEVIDALATYFEKPAYMKYNIGYSTAVSGLELDSEPVATSSKSFWQNGATSASKTLSRGAPITLQELGITKAKLAASANHSYASATSAYKKGRSDPLMRQAAAFYAERGRAEASSRRQTASLEASMLVDQQSTGDIIDLHGVSVLDGVDIAIDRVWGWWNSLGENKVQKARTNKLEVVTGYGRHSKDGTSPLRSRVFKALVQDGWKIEVLTGSCLVTGRA